MLIITNNNQKKIYCCFFYKKRLKKQNFIKFKNNGAEAPHYIAQVRFNYKGLCPILHRQAV